MPLLVGCLAASLVLRLTVGFGVVRGLSMWPALGPGDTILYVRHLAPTEGAVVVANLPGHGLIIKRVAGTGPRGCLLLGDNREDSYDSRDFGPLPERFILGRVVAVWPGSAAGAVPLRPGAIRVPASP